MAPAVGGVLGEFIRPVSVFGKGRGDRNLPVFFRGIPVGSEHNLRNRIAELQAGEAAGFITGHQRTAHPAARGDQARAGAAAPRVD
jgi:hypothetical protein